MTTTILIVNWENWPATHSCLEALTGLEQWAGGELDVLVVDNGSRDDSPQRIGAWAQRWSAPAVRLLRSEHNLGFAAGNNLGMEWILAQPDQPEFIWLLNNDTEVEPGALTALLEAAAQFPEVLLWGSTLLHLDGRRVQYAGGGSYWPLLSVQRAHMAGADVSDVVTLPPRRGLDFICAASMLARTGLFRDGALLNEEYFMYFEELDLCARLDSGKQIGWCPSSQVRHAGGGSTSASSRGLELRQYHENLSALKFTARHHPRCLWSVWSARLVAKPLLFLARWQLYLFRPWARALRDFAAWRGEKSNGRA